ncbi:MAG: hypothetical protein ACK5YZ_02935, partial [bacterium]
LGPQTAQNRSAAGWQWFADPRERVEIGKRGFFQQAPRAIKLTQYEKNTLLVLKLDSLPSQNILVSKGQ